MQIVIAYDIPNTKIRSKVADSCLDYGLDRVQYSVFVGDLHRVHQEELMNKLHSHLKKAPGKIYLYPLCERDWRARIEIAQEKKANGRIANGE